MLYGVMQPDEGEFIWQGMPAESYRQKLPGPWVSPWCSAFSLFPALTVAENIALALDADRSPAQLRRDIIDAAQRWGLELILTILSARFPWVSNNASKFSAACYRTNC